MREPKMKVQCQINSDVTDDYLKFMRQMNIKNCFIMFKNEHSNYEDVNRVLDKVRQAGLTVNDAGNAFIYKHPSIHLGLSDRDEWIKKYNDLNRTLGNAGVPVGYMTWDTGRVSTTRFAVGPCTREAVGRIVDMDEILSRKPAFGREYEEEEMWANFKYFLDAALPVCKEANIKIALHPNDPPHPKYEGCASLIYNASCYKKAIALADNSPYLGLKFCVGCWLEGGEAFGNVLEDLKYFIEDKRVYMIHFRNVSATLPKFEETLLEDGYMDMYKVMRHLVQLDYDGGIYVDHYPEFLQTTGGLNSSFAYATGYMKGLLNSAMTEYAKD